MPEAFGLTDLVRYRYRIGEKDERRGRMGVSVSLSDKSWATENLKWFTSDGMTRQDIRVSSWRGEWPSIWQLLSLTDEAY